MKPTSTATKGLIIALIMIALTLGMYYSGIDETNPLRWITFCVFIIAIIFSIIQYGKQIDQNATFGNYFAHGFKVAAAVTVLMVIFMIAFVYLDPAFKEKGIDAGRKAIESRKNMSEEDRQQALEMTKKLFMVFLIGGTLLYHIIIGTIASLIGAAVTKKHPRPLEDI